MRIIRLLLKAIRFRSLQAARMSETISDLMRRGVDYDTACKILNEKFK